MRLDATVDDVAEMVHHADERGVWATRGRRVLFRPAGDEDGWKEVARFPRILPRDLPIGSRLAARLLRLAKCNVHPTRSGKLLGIRAGTVLRLDGREARPLGQIQGRSLMNRAIAETSAGDLLFGEYSPNLLRRPVRIYRVDPDLERCEVACEIGPPTISHVHAVHVDPWVPGKLWVTTGDFRGECHLIETDEALSELRFHGDGSQLWRIVGIAFQEDRLCWRTDSNLEQNHIVSMERATGRIERHGEVESSTWYLASTSDGVHLATTSVEKGAGIQTTRATLLASRDGTSWTRIAAFEKDPLPARLFGWGALHLPSGRWSSAGFWLSGEGVRGLDGAAQRCSLALGEAA